MRKLRNSAFVIVGAVVLATLGLQASDLVRGIDSQLASLVTTEGTTCQAGELLLLLGERAICVDQFEASPSADCPHINITTSGETQANLNMSECVPQSAPAAMPWNHVSFTQAGQLCARAGKRLPTNEEWFKAVSGSVEAGCVLDERSVQETGTETCETPLGTYDMIGNVWEWVDGVVDEGTYDGRTVPEDGYVTAVDRTGVVQATAANPDQNYNDDYAWTDAVGSYVMIRGGFYGSGEDGGLYAQNLSVTTDLRTAGIGFRCVRDVAL